MLPSTGVNMPQLGAQKYWPIYGEAERLGCALAIHGGAHENLLMDDMSPYAVANALGHPMSQMICFAGIVFNGIFDKFPGLRIGFMEAGCAWLLTCMERFTGSWESHVQYDPRGRFLQLKKGEKIIDYIVRHIDDGRIFVGCEGEELSIAEAVRITGNKPYLFSTDYPHEVDAETCKHELDELRENTQLSQADKDAILFGNAQRFYQLSLS
jgi:predicted TIM-barrel fold metal-dependent hydrolase